jgi:hypothetical protein
VSIPALRASLVPSRPARKRKGTAVNVAINAIATTVLTVPENGEMMLATVKRKRLRAPAM